MDCSLPGSTIHGIFQARVLEWVAISFSRGSSWPRDRTQISCIAGRCLTIWATRKAREGHSNPLQYSSLENPMDRGAWATVHRVTKSHRWLKSLSTHKRNIQIRSVTQSCLTLCNPMNCSTPGLPVHHQLPKFTQTHVHRLNDAIQPSHPLSSPSPLAPNSLPASESFPMSQLFAWGGQSTGVSALASFLPKKSQGWSPSEWTGWTSMQSKGLSRVFSNTTVQKHQFFTPGNNISLP